MSNLVADSSPTVVLASGSPYRRQVLKRLGIPFIVASPDLDERCLEPESPADLVTRLAQMKADAVRYTYPDALIIGSDQVAVLDRQILRKPGYREANIQQLLRASGRQVQVLTGLCVLNTRTGCAQVEMDSATVHFRSLSRHQIECYVDREQPFACAGGFKSEGLGVALFNRVDVDDASTLIGLPLIPLIKMLENEHLDVLARSWRIPMAEHDSA